MFILLLFTVTLLFINLDNNLNTLNLRPETQLSVHDGRPRCDRDPVNFSNEKPDVAPLQVGAEAHQHVGQNHIWVEHIIQCVSVINPGLPAPNTCNLFRIILEAETLPWL